MNHLARITFPGTKTAIVLQPDGTWKAEKGGNTAVLLADYANLKMDVQKHLHGDDLFSPGYGIPGRWAGHFIAEDLKGEVEYPEDGPEPQAEGIVH